MTHVRFLLLLLVPLVFTACGLRGNLDRLDAGRKHADGVIEHLADEDAYAHFPANYFTEQQIATISSTLREQCNWPARRGKFIDFYMADVEGEKSVTYIYEYFLSCDSLRFILAYDTSTDSVVLRTLRIEPIENENSLLIDPMKSILRDKDWEKDLKK